jgi:hypothetical protein
LPRIESIIVGNNNNNNNNNNNKSYSDGVLCSEEYDVASNNQNSDD